MKRKIELLAPGGDIDSIKAAIAAGADAIYCGLNKFNARNRATNINFEDLHGIINLAHKHHCEVFLTLNIIIVGSEIPDLIRLLNKLVNTQIDGIIVQDLGLFYLLSKYFKGLNIHASTQLTTHNEGQIHFLNQLAAKRVNLSRELNINEIKRLTCVAQKNNMLTEIFVHGSQCISFSGICYLSSVFSGNSGNRGRCSQPCRDRYLTTPEGKNFPLNLKDNSAYFDLEKLFDAGVGSIKIEGRIKKLDYVYTVVNCWKNQLRYFFNHGILNDDNSDFYKVFNRDFSNAYLMGDINKNMFIDNPRDHSAKRFSVMTHSMNDQLKKEKIKYYDGKEKINTRVKNKIKQFSVAKPPLKIIISGKQNTPLTVLVKTFDTSFTVSSKIVLAQKDKNSSAKALNYIFFMESFKAINDTAYFLKDMELKNLAENLFIPFKEVTLIKKRILFILNGSKNMTTPIEVPFFEKPKPLKTNPTLAVLISSPKDIHLDEKTVSNVYFQLPNHFPDNSLALSDLFLKNKKLTPWFPSILIEENYKNAVKFLDLVHPKRIVTNNTGIAFEAYKRKIPWIAGPYLNIVNSFSLLCLKEKFNCSGSFISNEISKHQIKRLIKPENFELYYSIYHPILLLTTRLCLHHQTIGCEKHTLDATCLQDCIKSSSITNLKKERLLIKKILGNYHCIYNDVNFLNTDIITDLPNFFSGFFIDLRDIKTGTKINMDKSQIIKLFEDLLYENPDYIKDLSQHIYPTTTTQYKKGI
ncbi:MAG: U32 family peptidase [Desulfobacula sp.]|nr:U32 family peptidase [Desulfobacula sp.]